MDDTEAIIADTAVVRDGVNTYTAKEKDLKKTKQHIEASCGVEVMFLPTLQDAFSP